MADANTEAVGSMESQLSVYNESIQASLDKFKVAFQELSYDLINSDTIKGLVDFGTVFLRILDELIEHIGVLGTALTGLGIAKIFSTAVNGAKNVSDLSTAFSLFFDAIKGGSGKLEAFNLLLGEVGAGATGAGSAIGGLLSSLGGFLASPAGLVTGVVAAVAAAGAIAYNIRKKQQEELRKQATEATEKWTDDKATIEDYKARYTELNDQLEKGNLTEQERIGIKQQLLDLQNEISAKYGADASQLDLINGLYQTQLGLISQISEKEAHRSLQDNREAYQQSVDEMTKDREYTMYSNGSNSNLMKQIEWAYIRSGFKDQGDLSFKFTGDVSEADESIRTLMDRLEALKDTASETEKQFLDNVIGSASKLLKKNDEILKANQDNYRTYLEKSLYDDGFGDELAEYSRRTQEYNDALLSGDASKINEAKQQLDDYKGTVAEITSAHKEYGDFFDEVANSVDKTSEAVFNFKDIIDDGVAESTNNLSEYSDQIYRTVNEIKKLGLDGVDIQAILGNPQDAMYADLSQLAKLWNPDIDLSNKDDLQAFTDFLTKAVYGADAFSGEVDLAKSSFEDFMKSASASIDTIDKVNSTLVNSFKSGGLSARIDAETGKLTGDVQTILDAYKGADVSQVFEKTADGIIVNRDALRELQSEQEKTLKKEFGDRIAEAYDNWKEAISNKDLDAIDYWKEQYDNVRLLATAYEGATSAYQKWLDAQEMGEAGDMYDTVTSTALKRGQELYDQGLVGTNEFRAIAQLYSNEDLSTASIDELTAAYESGYQVVKKYFTDGQDGAQAFADKIVELGYATKDAEDNYEFFNGIDTQKVANDLGISVDLVEAAFKKLGDYGFNINFDFNTPEEALTQFESRLTQLNNKEVKPGVTVDIHNDEQLREIAEYILNLNDEEINAEFNISGTETVDEVIDKLKEHYEVKATVKTDTSNVQEPQNTTASVDYTTGNVEGVGAQTAVANYTTGTVAPIENQTAKVDYTTASVAPIENQKAKIDYSTNSVAKIPNQRTGIDYYTGSVESIPNQNATANYTVSVSGLNALPPDGEHRDIYIDVHTKQLYKGTVSRSAFQGMSRDSGIVSGTSHARGMLGKVGLKKDESALINELGAEIVVRPSEDSWMIFNNGMPTFASLKKDDVVFNAELTKKLLQTGKADEYAKILGSSHVNGTIKGNAHATVRGGGRFKKPTSSGGGGNGGSGGNGGNGGGSKNNNKNNSKSTKEAKDFKEVLDKIEIKIDRVERKISNLDTIASNTFNNQVSRANALSQSLGAVNLEIIKQTQGYRRYIKQANAVGLNSKLAAKVRNGEIGIQDVKDEKVWKKIEDYRKWLELALSCRDAIYKLKVDEAELWNQRFELNQTYYESRIEQYSSMYDALDSYIERAENTGKISANLYRTKQISEEQKKIRKLTKEYSDLETTMINALKSGKITYGSEGYYEMRNTLREINNEIISAKTNITELNKSIRETNWEIFDSKLETIENMNDELEFLYSLLGDEDKFYNDKGDITNNGVAGFGILATQYNISLKEHQKYANEIKKINKQIAKDPSNQELIKRRQELREADMKAIKSANGYKDSIVDLVKDGIKAQIDSMKELISKYTDLMDSQKDEIDYAKKVATAQDNINSIQKQLNAYANDDSEEGATRRQRLRKSLKDAQDSLTQTEEERRISQTKKLLSDLQEEYENILNSRLDNIDKLIEAVVEGVDANAVKISNAINQAAKNVGYTMSSDVSTIFADASNNIVNLVSYFKNGKFVDNVTSITNSVNNIESRYKKAVNDAENSARNNAGYTENKNRETTTRAQNAAQVGAANRNKTNKNSGIDGSWVTKKGSNGKVYRASWKFNDGSRATGWSKIDGKWYYFDKNGNIKSGLQTIGSDKYYIRREKGRASNEWIKINGKWYYFGKDGKAVSGWKQLTKDKKKLWYHFNEKTKIMDVGGVSKVSGSGKSNDFIVSFKKGYKKGTRSVGSNGMYWTNENSQETIIRKSDGAVLTKLNHGDTVFNSDATKTMWEFANNPDKFLRAMGVNNTVGSGNNINMEFNLSGLNSPTEFMNALRKDKRFERFVQEITLGRASGHGVLAKNAITF